MFNKLNSNVPPYIEVNNLVSTSETFGNRRLSHFHKKHSFLLANEDIKGESTNRNSQYDYFFNFNYRYSENMA